MQAEYTLAQAGRQAEFTLSLSGPSLAPPHRPGIRMQDLRLLSEIYMRGEMYDRLTLFTAENESN